MEIEVKFSLHHLEDLRVRLISMGATLESARHLERNIRFDTPDRELAGQKHVLRLRQYHRATLTYKRPHGPVESRDEYEVEIDDFSTGYELLNALGYTATAIYEKIRETYRIDPFLVMLDELPIGFFIEIEGPSMESIQQMSARLGLPWERRVQASYLDLFLRAGNALALELDEFTFDKFEGFAPINPELLGIQNVD